MFYGAEWFVFVIFYLVFLAVAVFIGYLVIKAAVRNGTIEAHHVLQVQQARPTDGPPAS